MAAEESSAYNDSQTEAFNHADHVLVPEQYTTMAEQLENQTEGCAAWLQALGAFLIYTTTWCIICFLSLISLLYLITNHFLDKGFAKRIRFLPNLL